MNRFYAILVNRTSGEIWIGSDNRSLEIYKIVYNFCEIDKKLFHSIEKYFPGEYEGRRWRKITAL